MRSTLELIKEKRDSHIKKGYNYDHDTNHTADQFIKAATVYMGLAPYAWPFDKASLKLDGKIENLVNAASMIVAAIDRLQRYEVGKEYKCSGCDQDGTFRVLKVHMYKNGEVFVTFTGLSGFLMSDKQTFVLGSTFDDCCEPI